MRPDEPETEQSEIYRLGKSCDAVFRENLAELVALARFVSYDAGFRHAPRLLGHIEEVGQRLRDRPLAVSRAHLGDVTIDLVGWDVGLRADLEAMIGMTFRPAGAPIHLERTTVPSIVARSDADLLFVEVPEWRAAPFVEAGFHLLPKRVSHVEQASIVGGDRETAYARRAARATTTAGLDVEIRHDEAALAEFDARLYRPTMVSRHAARARATPFAIQRLLLRRGALVFAVDRAGVRVSGALVAPAAECADRLQIALLGVRDGDYRAVSPTARLAPIVLARIYARERGFREIDHLVTRPFPRDGLFVKKARWGGRIVDLPLRRDRLALHVRRSTTAARRLLDEHPMLALSAGRLVPLR
jgi:hypothetical protein